jgi:quercetin dioxygenase-like cupin family protein
VATIRFVNADSAPWVVVRDPLTPDQHWVVAGPEDGNRQRHPHPGSETELCLHQSRKDPNVETLPHAHRTDEIIYVTEGQLHFGGRVVNEGDSVYVPANTLYGFRSGPEGAHFLIFRGQRDDSHIDRDEFVAERAKAHDST